MSINLEIVRDEEDSVMDTPHRIIPVPLTGGREIPFWRKWLWWISGRCDICGGEFHPIYRRDFPPDFCCAKCGHIS